MIQDVAVIGAGVSGLVCAQRLRQLGLRVVVIEKSRGLGGRLATRRLMGTHADHGVRCLEEQGQFTQALIKILCSQGILSLWTDTVYQLDRSGTLQPSPGVHPRYGAIDGITAVAKFLGNGLEVWRGQRVQAITPQFDRTWKLTLESGEPSPTLDLIAKSVVVTCPAPQALALVEPLADQGLPAEFLTALRSVRFEPCLTTIATYKTSQLAHTAKLPWSAITFLDAPDLAWLALDSSKQLQPQCPVVVIQSTATFAETHLEEQDLQPAGQWLLRQTAQQLQQPWLATPDLFQVQRWRYAFTARSLGDKSLMTLLPLPLGCSGDWCGGNTVEAALQSGWQIADQISQVSALSDSSKGLSQKSESEHWAAKWAELLEQISLNL